MPRGSSWGCTKKGCINGQPCTYALAQVTLPSPRSVSTQPLQEIHTTSWQMPKGVFVVGHQGPSCKIKARSHVLIWIKQTSSITKMAAMVALFSCLKCTLYELLIKSYIKECTAHWGIPRLQKLQRALSSKGPKADPLPTHTTLLNHSKNGVAKWSGCIALSFGGIHPICKVLPGASCKH